METGFLDSGVLFWRCVPEDNCGMLLAKGVRIVWGKEDMHLRGRGGRRLSSFGEICSEVSRHEANLFVCPTNLKICKTHAVATG